jgi:hypothetical protein
MAIEQPVPPRGLFPRKPHFAKIQFHIVNSRDWTSRPRFTGKTRFPPKQTTGEVKTLEEQHSDEQMRANVLP